MKIPLIMIKKLITTKSFPISYLSRNRGKSRSNQTHQRITNMSNIIRLEANNVKRLKAVRIEPTGATIVIGGRNGAGKSSILDCIEMAFAGKGACPDKPVRQGERKAKIVLETDELTVKRSFTAAGGSTLEVTNKDGLSYKSPQDVLDKLTSSLAFDPLAFIRLGDSAPGRAKQAAWVRDLAGVDVTDLEVEKRKLTEQRKEANRRIKDQEGVVNGLPRTGPERVDVSAVLAEMDAAERRNEAIAVQNRKHGVAFGNMRTSADVVTGIKQELQAAELEMEHAEGVLMEAKEIASKARKAADSMSLIDLEPLRKALADAEENNRKVNESNWSADQYKYSIQFHNNALAKLQTQVEDIAGKLANAESHHKKVIEEFDAIKEPVDEITDTGTYRKILLDAETTNAKAMWVERRKAEEAKLSNMEIEAENLTNRLEEIDTERTAKIKAGKLPIPDLAYDEAGVTYKGLPLDQASSAEQLRVGLAIAIAANPALKVMLIRDGSLLDEDSMKIVQEMAEQTGSQVWIEVVSSDKGRCTVVIEDGEVQP